MVSVICLSPAIGTLDPRDPYGDKPASQLLAHSVLIMVAYLVCHGWTRFLVAPIQGHYLPEVTAFASLLYLPHGIRVLAIWTQGAKAIPALIIAAFAAEVLFTRPEYWVVTRPDIGASILVGALSAWLGLVALRLVRFIRYPASVEDLHWSDVLMIGLATSVLNSIGQTLVFEGAILPDKWPLVLTVYAVGDVLGLWVVYLCVLALKRWFLPGEGM